MDRIFKDRKEAGILLGQALLKKGFSTQDNIVVIGLPRGGVPIAFEIANLLNSSLDVLFVRKLGLPFHEEVAMGAITEDGALFLDQDLIRMYLISSSTIEKIITHEKEVMVKRKIMYRQICQKKEVKGKTVILADDGLATGATMFAAIKSLRKENPKKIVVAVPVSPIETYHKLKNCADDVVCLNTPEPFFGVGGSYLSFPQVDDKEVYNFLEQGEKKKKEV